MLAATAARRTRDMPTAQNSATIWWVGMGAVGLGEEIGGDSTIA